MADLADTHIVTAGRGQLTGIARSTVSAGTATVSIGGRQITAAVVRNLTLAVNDPVLIVRAGSWWIVTAVLNTAAPTPPDLDTPPNPQPPVITGRLVVAPVFTGSYRDGWRTDDYDTIQGVYGGYGNSTGAVFYGDKPRSLAGATVTAAALGVRRNRGGVYAAQTTTLHLVTEATKPTGAPTLGSSATGPRLAVDTTDEAFPLTTAWAQAMVDGTAGGLAVHSASGSPYVRLAGRGTWGPAWTLTLDWRR